VVGSRIVGASAHRFVLDLRMGFSLMVWLLASWGALRAIRKGASGVTTAVLGFLPFAMLAVQSYGGEGVLRVFLFTSAPVALLGAHALHDFCAWGRKVRPLRLAAVAMVPVVALPLFLISRYGNEAYERVGPSDRQTVAAAYRMLPRGASLAFLTQGVAMSYESLTDYQFLPHMLDEYTPNQVGLIVTMMSGNPLGSYVLITPGQVSYDAQVSGYPESDATNLEKALLASKRFVVVYHNDDGGLIYKLVPAQTGAK
jgi:hypothetical protein